MNRNKKNEASAEMTRSSNWTQDEKHLLLTLISENVNIIENKKIDCNSMKKKSMSWAEIYRKFCSSSIAGTKRDIGQLKSQWKRMKTNAKSEASSHKKESRRTGGGPAPKPPTDITLKIQDLLPREFTELHNPYDDDSNNDETSQASTVDSDEAVTDGAEEILVSNTSSIQSQPTGHSNEGSDVASISDESFLSPVPLRSVTSTVIFIQE